MLELIRKDLITPTAVHEPGSMQGLVGLESVGLELVLGRCWAGMRPVYGPCSSSSVVLQNPPMSHKDMH